MTMKHKHTSAPARGCRRYGSKQKRLTVVEQPPVAAAKRCPECAGHGFNYMWSIYGPKPRRCPECQGTGGGNATLSHEEGGKEQR